MSIVIVVRGHPSCEPPCPSFTFPKEELPSFPSITEPATTVEGIELSVQKGGEEGLFQGRKIKNEADEAERQECW